MAQPPWFIGRSLALLACFAATGSAATQPSARPRVTPAPRTMRVEDVISMRSFSDLTWSADGRRLAFVVSEPDTAEDSNNQDIWLVDFATGGPALRLTRHPKADVSPTFSPSGDTLAFVASRGTGDDAHSAIWMMSLRGGEPWAFGSYAEGVSEVAWSPDGRSLAYVMADTLAKSVKDWRKKRWDQVVEDERAHLLSVDRCRADADAIVVRFDQARRPILP